MFMNRIAKWAAVGILAIAAVPTIGMGRTRASLPSASVTQTPATPVGIKHASKKASAKHVVSHKRTVKASAKKHTRKSAAHKTSGRKASVHKSSTHKTSARTSAHKKSTHKASHKKTVTHKKSAK
jgi:DNA-binding protein HU-beta